MSEQQKKIKLVFARFAGNTFSTLSSAILEHTDLALEEIITSVPNLAQQIAGLNPDAAIVYSPASSPDLVNSIHTLITKIPTLPVILITHTTVGTNPLLPLSRVINYVIPAMEGWQNNPKALKDIILHVRHSYDRHHKGELKAKIETNSILEHLFVLPPRALNNYIIAFGASTGGTEAQCKLFKRFPNKMPGMVVVQHMPPVFTKMFADRLNNELPFDVTEAVDNALIAPNTIHIAPGDRQLEIQKRGNAYYTRLGGTEKVSGHCPSVDVLFKSVAKVAGKQALGVILTGMGADGAEGLLEMRSKGAFTVGQDESSCVVYGMPCKAYEKGAVVTQASLLEIPKVILSYLSQSS